MPLLTFRRLSTTVLISLALFFLDTSAVQAETYPDRFVWIFGWNLRNDPDVVEITNVLQSASQHGINGAVMSLGLDTLCKKFSSQPARARSRDAGGGRAASPLLPHQLVRQNGRSAAPRCFQDPGAGRQSCLGATGLRVGIHGGLAQVDDGLQ
jgi:hypothetical protein